MKTRRYIWIWVIFFAVAMGYLEAVVVIYLREIYYPGGFVFPLVTIPGNYLAIEMGREAATLIMLLAVGMLSGENRVQRLAFFLLAFGVWDLSYYIFLKVVIGWPAGFGTWDLLFLLPTLWVGPVWAPCLLSLTMIVLATLIARAESFRGNAPLPFGVLRAWIIGAVLVIAAFWIDPIHHSDDLKNTAYIPYHFPWILFVAGEAAIMVGVFRLVRTTRHVSR
jgi:hypothetical protein